MLLVHAANLYYSLHTYTHYKYVYYFINAIFCLIIIISSSYVHQWMRFFNLHAEFNIAAWLLNNIRTSV